jgi:transposase-like protein
MHFTPEMEARIVELYTPPYVRGAIAAQARDWGCSTASVCHRARGLGLSPMAQQGGYPRWTPEEIRLLRQMPTLTHREASHALAKAGYSRTMESVMNFRLRDGWRSRVERDEMAVGYSAKGLANLLGVDATTVLRWIRQGLLKATREEGTEKRCAFYRVQPKHLYDFLTQYVHYWEPAKVDKYWLMDVLTAF